MALDHDTRAIEVGARVDLRFKLFDPVGVREAAYLAAALGVIGICFAVLRGMTVTERLFTGMFLSAPLILIAFARFQDLTFEHWLSKKGRFLGMRKRYGYRSLFDGQAPVGTAAPDTPVAQSRTQRAQLWCETPTHMDAAETTRSEDASKPAAKSAREAEPCSPTQPRFGLHLPRFARPNITLPKLGVSRAGAERPALSARRPRARRVDLRVGEPALVSAVFMLLVLTGGVLSYVVVGAASWR